MRRQALQQLIDKNGAFTDGDWVESKDQDPDGQVRLIQLADIGDGEYLNKSARFMTLEKAKTLKCTFLQAGDILVARMPDPVGRACIFPGDNKTCVTVVDVCIIRPCSSSIDNRWLMHQINSQKFRNKILQFVSGTTRQRISRSNLAALEISVPPLPEQKRIAAILDKADSIRRKRQEAIKLADEFLRSVFLDMFGDPVSNPKGWEVREMKDLARIQIGPFGTQLHKEDYIEDGIPLINPSHIVGGKCRPDVRFTISREKHTDLAEYHLEIGDVIMGRRGEMGRCAIISEIERGWLCGTGSLYIRPHHPGFMSEYLYALLTSNAIKLFLEGESLGATMPNLNKTIVGRIKVPVPDESIIEKYSKLKTAITKSRSTQIEFSKMDLTYSLSQGAFIGRL